MAYRNDVDALQARLDALHGEVGEKTRERDEVAHLLTEARARAAVDGLAADWAAGGPQRRRGRRLWIASIGTAAALLGMLVTLRVTRAAAHPDRFTAAAREFSILTDAMCACHDKQCSDGVTDALNHWATEMATDADTRLDTKPTDEQMKQFTDLGQRYAGCMAAATTPAPIDAIDPSMPGGE